MKRLILSILLINALSLFLGGELTAQEYQIGPEDVVSISFWQQPELNTTVRVSQNGTIVLPVIGSLTAAGLTTTDLATKIVDKISLFNENISQAAVVVTQYGSNKVYVTGQVMQPGKYAFETMPSLWKVILEAGGPIENADLKHITIIRGGAEAGKSISVDLDEFLKQGDVSMLPPIYPDDTINVPATSAVPTGIEAGTAQEITFDTATSAAGASRKPKIIYIYGQVVRPGGYPLERELDLLEAIILAGGPTLTAKLDQVKVITLGKPYSTVATINLEKYSRNGTPPPFALKSGDTIYIPQKQSSFFGGLFQHGGIMYDILRIMATTVTSYFVYSWLTEG